MEEYRSKKRVRDESSGLRVDSPEVKRIREDLLENFDDGEIYATSHELDLFMKRLAEEIMPANTRPEEVIDLTSESNESQLDLGYLLGASDDDLGLPSSIEKSEGRVDFCRIESGSSELGNSGGYWEFGDEVSGFDFEFGDENYSGNEFVALDGLFDYSDMGFGSSDLPWRPETLPAK